MEQGWHTFMKLLGALLFIVTTTWIGFEWSHRLTTRPKHIRQVKSALQILEAEILYSQSPLKEAFAMIAKQMPDPTRSFFAHLNMDLQQEHSNLVPVWAKNISNFKKQSCLGNNEIEIMLQFGRTLGRHDFYQQQKQIQLALGHLDRELEEARDEQIRYSKMVKSLGILFGLFIVLLLM
ncbi:MAG TPA: stage III sporulation protein SpoIIIAB [Pseudogracilibacillus sp.]|nr:stage III sporulation protein SpoIIIAB [Pseudogracilibacillus sp.]